MNQIQNKKGFAAVAVVAAFSALTLVVLLLGLFARPEQLKNTPAKASTPVVISLLKPVADTMIRKENPNRNYGVNTTLSVKGRDERIVYMKFNLEKSTTSPNTFSPSIVSAKLRLKTTREGGSKANQVVALVENETWSETELTYNNTMKAINPSLVPGTVIASFPLAKSNSWVETSVTEAVQTAMKKNKILSIAIMSRAPENGDGLSFYSKESVVDQPVLTVEYAPFPNPSDFPSPYPSGQAFKCKDSDGGKNYSVAGTVETYMGDVATVSRDVCSRLINGEYIQTATCFGPDCQLTEYYCGVDRAESVTTQCSDACHIGACISGTPTPTPTPALISVTPKPEACNVYNYLEAPRELKPAAVGFIEPQNPTIFTWTTVPGAVKYAIRIDDLTDGFDVDYTGGSCSPKNPNDVCYDSLSAPYFKQVLQEGHWYRWWVHAIDGCNHWSTSQSVDFRIVAPSMTPTPTAFQ